MALSPCSHHQLTRPPSRDIHLIDTLQRRGLYDPPPGVTAVLGLEAAGVVEAVGSECNAGFAHGDNVMVLVSGGGYAEFLTVGIPYTHQRPCC